MENKEFLNNLSTKKFQYKTLHATGQLIHFSKPVIGYILKGSAEFLYDGNTYTASEGDLIYIAYKTAYYSIWRGSPDIEFYSIEFSFISQYAFFDYKFQILKNYDRQIFEKIYSSEHLGKIGYFNILLSDIYSKMKKQKTDEKYILIKNAADYIEKNFDKPFKISEIAKLCSMSESRFFINFKNMMGVSPINYKHNICIQHALDLLINTDLSIEEISDKLGFSSSNYFRKIFNKITNESPKQIRAKK